MTDEIRRRLVNEASARVPQRDLAREYAFNLSLDGSREVARLLAQAMAIEGATAAQSYHVAETTSARLRTLLAAEPALFMPDAPTAKLQAKLRKLLRERDDWSQLLASSALLMLGKGTPELCRDRNALLAKAIEHGSQFTFPAELCAETERNEFRNQLPELLHLTFLQTTTHSWLRPEFFEPERPESAYFLSQPRKFFTLAAEVLDPGGDTELAKWREP